MTERPRATPRLALGAVELRLYAAVVLAVTYLVAWRALTADGPPLAARSSASGEATASTAPSAGAAIWLDDLPAAQRPAVVAPPGWQLASRAELAAPAPRVVRAPAQRPLRVRTRSS